jgi:hypothetical protein
MLNDHHEHLDNAATAFTEMDHQGAQRVKNLQ